MNTATNLTIALAKESIANELGITHNVAAGLSDEYVSRWIAEQNIAADHLTVPHDEIVEMIVRASIRENRATNRAVIADAREQGAYWTTVLTVVLARQGYRDARSYANVMIDAAFYAYATGGK